MFLMSNTTPNFRLTCNYYLQCSTTAPKCDHRKKNYYSKAYSQSLVYGETPNINRRQEHLVMQMREATKR